MVALAVLSLWFELMILKVFSKIVILDCPYWYLPQPLTVRSFRSSAGRRKFQVFLLSVRQFSGQDHSGIWINEESFLPCPTVSLDPAWLWLTNKPQVLHFSLPGGRCTSCPALPVKLSKSFIQSSLDSMKAESFSLIRAKYPFSLLVWSGSSLEDGFYCVAIIA